MSVPQTVVVSAQLGQWPRKLDTSAGVCKFQLINRDQLDLSQGVPRSIDFAHSAQHDRHYREPVSAYRGVTQ